MTFEERHLWYDFLSKSIMKCEKRGLHEVRVEGSLVHTQGCYI